MTHRFIAGLALLIAAACSPAEEPPRAEIPPAAPGVRPGCFAQAAQDWSAVGSQYYVVEAEAHGETCAEAVATLRIESQEGARLFTREYPVRDVPLAFNPNNTQTGLRADLEAWTRNVASPETGDYLPAWPAGAQRPPNFQPAVSRNRYESIRGAQGALFCYPDGNESNACVALAGDTATYLGSLTPERP